MLEHRHSSEVGQILEHRMSPGQGKLGVLPGWWLSPTVSDSARNGAPNLDILFGLHIDTVSLCNLCLIMVFFILLIISQLHFNLL